MVHWPLIDNWPQPAQPLLTVRNVTAHPSMTSVPTSYYLTQNYKCLCSPHSKGLNPKYDYHLLQVTAEGRHYCVIYWHSYVHWNKLLQFVCKTGSKLVKVGTVFFETQCSFIARTGQVGPVQSSSTPKRKRAVVSKKRGEQKRARYFQRARDSMYQRVEASETLNGT